MNRLPPEAFDHYVGLGPERSYEAVAQFYGVSKRAVTKRASSEGWQKRLSGLEAQARQRSDEQIVETIKQMKVRHLKTLQVVQRKALEALKSYSLTTAMEAVRALDVSIKQERLIRGEPSERLATSVEDTIRREYSRWLDHADDAAAMDEVGPAESENGSRE